MSQQLKPADVEAALVELLAAQLKKDGVTVEAVSDRSFDADGNLIANPPAVLVLWSGAQYSDGQDNQQTQYDAMQPVGLLCGARSLRGSEKERTGAQELVAAVVNIMAGARLPLSDGTRTQPTKLMNVEMFQFSKDFGTWYTVTVGVNAFVQFDGENG